MLIAAKLIAGGVTWSQGATFPGTKKVIFNALGEVITLATPVFYNGTSNGTTGVNIALVPEDLLFTSAPTFHPTHSPSHQHLNLGCYPYERKISNKSIPSFRLM